MGVINFTKFLQNNYTSSISSISNDRIIYDHIYIDLNVILHRIIRCSNDENELLNRLCSCINNILRRSIPRKTLTLASDGIAPFAKIILQRKRRLQYIRNLKGSLPIVNPLQFTPGTHFMKSLTIKLQDYINSIKKKYNIQVNLLTYGKGEAEIKLVSQLITNDLINNIKVNSTNETHCIFSSDSDIFVIIASIDTKNIFINNSHNIIDFDKLIELHANKMIENISNKHDIYDKIKRDFSFVSLFIGNDYIPKVAHINFEMLWESYINTFKSFHENMQFIVNYENNNTIINKKFMIKLCYFIQKKLDKKIFKFQLENFIIEQYDNYIMGILWCHDTYRNGHCKKLDYMCNVNVPIQPLGLMLYFEFGYYENNIYKFNYELNDINNDINYIDEEIYAILILPKMGAHLIEHKKIYDLNQNELNILYEIEECLTCASYHKQLSLLHQDDNRDKDLVTNIMRKYRDHIKIHNELNIEEIIKLIKIINTLREKSTKYISTKKLIKTLNISQKIQRINKNNSYLF